MQRVLNQTTFMMLLALTVGAAFSSQARADLFLVESRRFNRSVFLEKLRKPGFAVTDDEKGEAEIGARSMVYPLTDRKVQENLERVKFKNDRSIYRNYPYGYYPGYYVKQAKDFLLQIHRNEFQNKGLRKEFCRQMDLALNDILSNPQQPPIAQVNATIILADLAQWTEVNATVDSLLKLLIPEKDALGKPRERSQGVRLYAFRGLKNILGQSKTPVTNEQLPLIAEILIGHIERKPDNYVALSPREQRLLTEGQRYLRREAIKALAQIHAPFVKAGQGNRIEPIHTLLGVVEGQWANGTKVDPSPRLDEQMEAALGILKLQSNTDPTYQPEYAVFPIADMIMNSMLDQYRKERAFFTETRDGVVGAAPRYPYKLYAVRFQEAFDILARNNRLKKLGERRYDAAGNPVLGVFVNEGMTLMNFIVSNDPRPSDLGIKSWKSTYGSKRPKSAFQAVSRP